MAEIFMFRGVDYELGFNDYYQNDSKSGISAYLNAKIYQISNTEFSYRIINHWEKNKLTTSIRKGGTGWRKYSIMDRVWLYIVREMRNFGISLAMIKKVKANLIVKKKEVLNFPALEYYFTLTLINKPVFLLIFPDGQSQCVTDKELQMNREFSSANNHFQINLNAIAQKIFPSKPLKIKFKDISELSFEERRFQQILRLELFYETEIQLQSGNKLIFNAEDKSKSEEAFNIITKKQYRQIKMTMNDEKILIHKLES